MVSRADLLAMLEAGDVAGAIDALRDKRGRSACWPWRTLEAGESFFAEGVSVASMRAQAANAARRTGRRFRVQASEGGCTVFLIDAGTDDDNVI